ncbi:tail fiber assembly protein [Enterobacter kobei]|uniref:tail fiber assembly protein n=1 Tax=Enterobacter kobei TaxID=208224 RepID=UPI0032AF72B6
MTAGLILTQAGADEIEAAYQAGKVVSIVAAAFGDGGGNPVVVSPSATALAGRFGEVPLSAGETIDGMIGGMAIIPCADYPGRVVREFGLESESGTLIAYGAYPDTYLPGQSDSVIKELIVKFVMPLVHAQSVTLVVDPSIAILTQENGDKRYYRRSLRLQEVQDEGAAAQQELRENIGCGTAATKDWGYLSGKLLPHGAYGIGNYTPLPGSPTEGGNTLERMASYTGFYAHKGGYNTQGYGYGMPSELADGEDYAVIAVKASQTPNMVFSLVWADDGLWFDTLDQGMAGRKKWARVFSDRHPPSAAQTGALPADDESLSVDLNTLGAMTSAGVYYQTSNAGATAANHYPAQAAGTLFVTRSAYGCQQMYITYSNRIFVRALTGNWTGSGPWSEWAEMYGPSNNPAPDDVNCIQRDGCHIGGFASGDAARPYMRHTASNVAVELAKVGDSYTKKESDALYITGVRQSTELNYTRPGDQDWSYSVPPGCSLTGLNVDDGSGKEDSIMNVYYRQQQVCINGSWVNTGYSRAFLSAAVSVSQVPKKGLKALHSMKACLFEIETDGEKTTVEGVADYVDVNGYLWSLASQALTGSIFIAVDDAGIIRQIDADATMLRPDGLSVYGLDALPDGCSIDKKWIFDGNDVTPAPVNYAVEAEKLKARLMRDAEAIIAPLQRAVKYAIATESEKQLLEQWEVYTVLLSRVDTSLAPDVEWPPVPV